MKRNYEGVIVLDTTGHEADVDQLVQGIGRAIESEGGALEQIEQLGRKDFSYHFSALPEAIEKIKSALNLNTAVHLQHYQLR